MGLDTYADLIDFIQSRADEPTDGSSDFETIMSDLVAQAHRDIILRHPFADLVSSPPGAFVTSDDITSLTITVSSTGTSVAGTLSSAPSGSISISGWKLKPGGKTWGARITSHTAGATAITIDAVPETLAAGAAVTLFQDEYDLASDLGVFLDGLWDQAGTFVPLESPETLRSLWPDPPTGATIASAFCRLTRRKIKFSHYPNSIRRYEYPYIAELSDPVGSGTLSLPAHLRPVLAEGALALLYQMKVDKRQGEAQARFEAGIEKAIMYERRRMQGVGQSGLSTRPGGYADVSHRAWG